MTYEEKEIANYLGDVNPSAMQLLFKMRKLIQKYLPPHDENLRWRVLAYDKPNMQATVKDNICTFKPDGKYVQVGIPLGVFFKDPTLILEGNLRYKRHITIRNIQDFNKKEIRHIILQSYEFDSSTVLYKQLPNIEHRQMTSKI